MQRWYELREINTDENSDDIKGKKTGDCSLEEAHWWIFLLEDSVLNICSMLSKYFYWIKLPNILWKWDDDNEFYTMQEWYGGFYGMFHCHVCSPVFQWCQKKKKHIYVKGGK